MIFRLIKLAVLLVVAGVAYITGYLALAVGGIVTLHVLVAAGRLGFAASMVAHAIPASLAVLGVAAMSSERLEFVVSIGVALACAVAYGVVRPKAPKRLLRLGALGLLARLS